MPSSIQQPRSLTIPSAATTNTGRSPKPRPIRWQCDEPPNRHPTHLSEPPHGSHDSYEEAACHIAGTHFLPFPSEGKLARSLPTVLPSFRDTSDRIPRPSLAPHILSHRNGEPKLLPGTQSVSRTRLQRGGLCQDRDLPVVGPMPYISVASAADPVGRVTGPMAFRARPASRAAQRKGFSAVAEELASSGESL